MALGSGRRRRAECAARPRGHRRPDLRHRLDAVLRARGVQHHSSAPRPKAGAGSQPRSRPCPSLIESHRRRRPRRLRRVGGAFVLLAIAVVAYGLVSRAAQNSRLHALTEAQAVPTVAVVTPTSVENHARPGPARAPGGLHPCADLRARPGVPEELEVRYRQQGEGGRRARRNRYARSRPAAHAGARRPERRRGQCQARADHRGALAVARRHRRGRQAGRRPAHLHLERQYRSGQGGAGERRSAGRRGGLQTPGRAVRRHRHRARNRHRRADQCGSRRRRGAVRGLRDEQAARLRQRAAELCAERAAGHQGHDPRARASRQDLQRNGRGFRPGRQPEHRHDADADSSSTTAPAS